MLIPCDSRQLWHVHEMSSRNLTKKICVHWLVIQDFNEDMNLSIQMNVSSFKLVKKKVSKNSIAVPSFDGIN